MTVPTPTELEGLLERASEALDVRLAAIGGCSDGYCQVVRPKGMHTNGGCRCLTDKYKAQRVVAAYLTFRATLTLNRSNQND